MEINLAVDSEKVSWPWHGLEQVALFMLLEDKWYSRDLGCGLCRK